MKIAFITSCLEPGRDGVGDYTRSLALQLQKGGGQCCLLSLCDPWSSSSEASEGTPEVVPVPELRLGPALPWERRVALARAFLDRFGPEWVSLQFVPYGFDKRGIVRGLGKYLQPLAQGRRVHVMFHELWIGGSGSGLKERAVGSLQKACVLRLMQSLQPRAIHTSNGMYVRRLAGHGLRAGLLPMFGAIPVGQGNGDNWLLPALSQAGLDLSGGRERALLLGFFGTLHPIWPPEPLLSLLLEAGRNSGKRVALLSIGRLGPGEELWARMAEAYRESLVFLRLSEQPVERVSQFLLSMDAGVAASPYSLLGKSSSAAAMQEHGLRVIVNRDDASASAGPALDEEREKYLLRLDDRFAQQVILPRPCLPTGSRLAQVAARFRQDLEQAS